MSSEDCSAGLVPLDLSDASEPEGFDGEVESSDAGEQGEVRAHGLVAQSESVVPS